MGSIPAVEMASAPVKILVAKAVDTTAQSYDCCCTFGMERTASRSCCGNIEGARRLDGWVLSLEWSSSCAAAYNDQRKMQSNYQASAY